MDILAASYKNIGPFVDREVSVYFDSGTYLIRAPIGTGKSFLFFDGPVFGLYKYSRRPILNRSCPTGKVFLLFSISDQVWAVERELSATKTGGESVRSKLYTSDLSVQQRHSRLAGGFEGQYVNNSFVLSERYLTDLKEIEFSSQRELDQSLLDLLPPKEVVLSTNFLLQDAPNVFELPPAERVVVFKHLFGLLGIDEAKDLLAEKRREIQTTIKVKQDSSSLDTKLGRLVKELKSLVDVLRVDAGVIESSTLSSSLDTLYELPFIQDLHLIEDTLKLSDLKLEPVPVTVIDHIRTVLHEYESTYNQLTGESKQLVTQRDVQKSKQDSLKHQIDKNKREIAVLQESVSTDIDKNRQLLVDQKGVLVQQHESVVQSIPFDLFTKYGYEVSSIRGALDVIVALQQEGSIKKQAYEHQKENLQKTLAELETLKQEGASLDLELGRLQKRSDEQSKFHCDRIEGDCPYVSLIKGASLKLVDEQIATIQKKRSDVEQKIVALTNAAKDQELVLAPGAQSLEELKHKLESLDRKLIKKLDEQEKDILEKIKHLDNQLLAIEQKSQEQKNNKERLVSLEAENKQIERQLVEDERGFDDLEKQYALIQEQAASMHITQARSLNNNLNLFVQTYQTIGEVSREWADNQLLIKRLQEQETQIKQLYQIFSKELLFYVVKDFLPQLQELMNTLLDKLVGYTVRFELPENIDEKVELNIEIHDDKGVRSVKSLSGGQLVILKLVRILAVGKLMHAQCMFLDETINNLDKDTVGRVAQLLQDYVLGSSLKLYVVTHSPQIQALGIRDTVIDLGEN